MRRRAIAEPLPRCVGRWHPCRARERQTWLTPSAWGISLLLGSRRPVCPSGAGDPASVSFRHTYVIRLANGTIANIGDRKAYELGSYQLWAGWHSRSSQAPEAMVDQAVAMLETRRVAARRPLVGPGFAALLTTRACYRIEYLEEHRNDPLSAEAHRRRLQNIGLAEGACAGHFVAISFATICPGRSHNLGEAPARAPTGRQ